MEAGTSVSIYAIVNNDDCLELDKDVNKNVIYFTLNEGIEEETSIDGTSYLVQDDMEVHQLEPTAFNSNLKIVTLNNEKFIYIATEKDEDVEQIEPELLPSHNYVQVKQKTISNIHELVPEIETENSQIDTLINVEPYQMILYKNISQPDIILNSKKKFKCLHKDCEKVYTSSQHLNVHMRSHVNSKPYSCTFEGCEKNFTTNYSLKSHLRTHTGEKPYTCRTCFKSFKTSGDLQKHIRIHTGEKPFECPIVGCGKSFTTSNIRKVHIRSHTGERPYVCDYPNCGKSFASSTNYKNHSRIHSGEKPYSCTIKGCEKRFTEYSSFYKHQVVHQVEKPYKCNYCKQHFKSEHTLNIHKKAKHGIRNSHSVHAERDVGVFIH